MVRPSRGPRSHRPDHASAAAGSLDDDASHCQISTHHLGLTRVRWGEWDDLPETLEEEIVGGEEEDRVLEEEEIMAGEEEDRVLEEEEVDELLLELSSGSTPSINQLIRALLGCIFALSCLLLAHWAIYAFPLLQHHLLLPLLFLPPLLIVFPRLRVMPLGDKISQMFGLLSKWLLLRKRGNTTRTKIDRLVSHESRKKKKKKKKQAKKKKQKQRDLSRAGLFRPDLRGMDKYEIEALEYLEHRKSSLLGICGMRGVGKSTLLWLLHTNYADHSSFDYIFHVEAGPGFTVATLQGVLARTIGLDQAPEIAQVNMISSFLRGKTFLVLLDDLHFSIDLAAAGLPMPLGHRQKVIFTTRGQSICAEMGCVSNTIRMECLEEEDAWDLFKYNVGGEIIDYDSEIEDLAKKMVMQCRGFPDALCTVGRTMSIKRDIKAWRVAYDLLRRKVPLHSGMQYMDDDGYPCLQYFENEF